MPSERWQIRTPEPPHALPEAQRPADRSTRCCQPNPLHLPTRHNRYLGLMSRGIPARSLRPAQSLPAGKRGVIAFGLSLAICSLGCGSVMTVRQQPLFGPNCGVDRGESPAILASPAMSERWAESKALWQSRCQDAWHGSPPGRWIDARRAAKAAPPWPSFHPLPTRPVFESGAADCEPSASSELDPPNS